MDEISASELPFEFRDSQLAERLLARLAERVGAPRAATVLEAVLAALPESPDPDMALLNLERWSAQLPTPAGSLALLRDNPRLAADVLYVFGASQYLSNILGRDPWLYTIFLEPPAPPNAPEYAAAVAGALRSLRRPESRREALRRVKRREFLRIGWRDLVRRAPLEEVVAEISDLADALVGGALRLAREEVDPSFPSAVPDVRFAVIALGKLGARELNYSSDIDLVFVSDGESGEPHRRYATRLAETLIAVLSQETGEGRCFRVDMRLRPEGRSGALVRSLGAFRTYYDRWAETWERQALIKARPVAGDPELGALFMELVRPVVYRRLQGVSLLEDVREMRTATLRKLDRAGEADVHVKEGRGTIREIEFTVQLLQLLFGAEHPALQVPDTHTALLRAEAEGLFTTHERAALAEGYRFFRELEHRLQLLHDLPVRRLPDDPTELRRLARTMGFQEAVELQAAFVAQRNRVEALTGEIHARLGIRAGGGDDGLRASLLTAETPSSAAALRVELESRGFPDTEGALSALVRLAAGGPHLAHPASTRRLFADLAPRMLENCAAAADPTLALKGAADLADRKLLHRALYQTLLENPQATDAMCRFAGAAPAAMRVVLRYPELADLVTDDDQLARRKSCPDLRAELDERLEAAASPERRISALRRFKLREFALLAARHVLAAPEPHEETSDWSDAAEVLLSAALAEAVRCLRDDGRWPEECAGGFAVIGLGRLGGRDLHFASDMDLMYVYGSTEAAAVSQQDYELLARSLMEVLQTVTEDGSLWDVDLRLRPEGRQGFQVASLDAVRRYYSGEGRAQTWEYQMLARARHVAGDPGTAAQFLELVRTRVYRDPMPAEWRDDIRAMKRRIERERVGDDQRQWHIKLGPGGLSDIEFTVQFLQLAAGGADPSLRHAGTHGAICALQAAGNLTGDEAGKLASGHAFLTRLRQSLTLLSPEGSPDTLPVHDDRLGRAVARALGFESFERLRDAYTERTEGVRDVFLRHLS